MKGNRQARQNILRRIEQHQPEVKTELPKADILGIYSREESPLTKLFARELENVNGHCIQCRDKEEAISQISKMAKEHAWGHIYCESKEIASRLGDQAIYHTDFSLEAEAGIIACESIIARTGSLLASSANGRRKHSYPEHQIVIGHSHQLVYDMDEALENLRKKYAGKLASAITLITGPSRTADIEKTLIMGAHGPKTLTVLLIAEKEGQA